MITLRLRAPSGVSTIQLADSATLSDLLSSISASTSIPSGSIDVRIGFPRPQPLPASDGSTALSALGIRTGETLQVSEKASGSGGSAPAVGATPAAPSRSAIPAAPVKPPPPTSIEPTPSRPSAPSGPLAPTPSRPPVQQRSGASGGSSDGPVAVQTESGYLVLRVVPDDNSCLFRAAGLVLEHGGPGTGDVAVKLRQVVAEAVRKDQERWSEVVLGRQPEEYVRTILGKDSWGGAIELAILSEHYQTEVCSIDVQSGRIDRFGEENHFMHRVVLIYSGIHYDALTLSPIDPSELPSQTTFPPEIGFDTTIFSSDDDTILSAATVIVSELRSKHAYTDTANFDLKCELCGVGLVGEKGAREHATQTGHTSFGEY